MPDPVEAFVPTSGWRIYTIGSEIPRVDPAAYRLTIAGAVERPVTYSLADLRALPRAEQVSDFHCVTGWSVEDVRWTGVRIRDLLAGAGPLPSAGALSFVSAEHPYVDSLTLDQALLPDVMLAWAMDGLPLTRPHGAPLRFVVPAMYGYKSVKHLVGLDFLARYAAGPAGWKGHPRARLAEEERSRVLPGPVYRRLWRATLPILRRAYRKND